MGMESIGSRSDSINMRYDYITNKHQQVEIYCKNQFPSKEYIYDDNIEFLIKMICLIDGDFTIILEEKYMDKFYNDSYQIFYSGQHSNVSRYCKRLSFFNGEVSVDDFINHTSEELNKRYIGSCVIIPNSFSSIGRTYLDPLKLERHIFAPTSYMIATNFKIHIGAHSFTVKTFPYRGQDGGTMTCSEVTVMNILEYFGTRYPDHSIVYPSTILDLQKEVTYDRVLPAHGMNYYDLTRIMIKCGVSACVYNIDAIGNKQNTYEEKLKEFHRIFHQYVDSGFPVALGFEQEDDNSPGHSITCIGYKLHQDLSKTSIKDLYDKNAKISLINCADLINDYIINDDNQLSYQVKPYTSLTIHNNLKISDMSVTMYKKMYMDSYEAYNIVTQIISTEKHTGISSTNIRENMRILNDPDKFEDKLLYAQKCSNLGDKDNPIILRLFATSSTKYKEFKINTLKKEQIDIKKIYNNILMPRFIWVCEIYSWDSYKENLAIGEIILDATSSVCENINSAIVIHYPHKFGYRDRDEDIDELKKMFSSYYLPIWFPFKRFDANLLKI